METLQDRSASGEESSPGGPIGRIAGHTQGLVEDLREWIDLRIDLAILEIEERVDELRNDIALGLALAFLGFFAALFVLTTVALGLGWVLGHPFWGFLIVSLTLVVVVTALVKIRPVLVPSSNLFERLRGRPTGGTPDAPSAEDVTAAESDASSENGKPNAAASRGA